MTIRAAILTLPLLAACEAQAPDVPERPMDEVPVQQRLANGDRQYSFKNGCVVVLEPGRAVMKTEGDVCELHHRDIALLYASAD